MANVGRPRTSNLVTFSIAIPKPLQRELERIAGDSPDSRNAVITRVLTQYANGELVRADGDELPYHRTIKARIERLSRREQEV